MPEAKTFKTSIRLEDSLSKTVPLSTEEPTKVVHIAIIWTPNRNSRSSNSSRKIGISLHESLLTCLEFLGN
jgi:hypothetical protein